MGIRPSLLGGTRTLSSSGRADSLDGMRSGWLPRRPVPETSPSMEASMCRWAAN